MVLDEQLVDKALARYYNSHTTDSYRSQLRDLIGKELSFDNVANWVEASSGSARATIVVRRAALRSILEYCKTRELCDNNLIKRIESLRFPGGRPPRKNKPLSEDDIHALIGATRTTEEKVLIYVLAYTGLRLGSVARLTFELASGQQQITTKRDRQITVYANKKLRQLLSDYMEECGASIADYVFTRRDGSATYYRHLYRIFNNVADRAGMKGIKPHQMRHTFATRLDGEGVSPFVIKELLGHEQLDTTMRYVSVDRKSMIEAVSMLA